MADLNDQRIRNNLGLIRKRNLQPYRLSEKATLLREKNETLTKLTENKETIDLSQQGLENEDLKNLGKILKTNTTTTTLNLANNSKITSGGLNILLKELEKNMTLRTVNLDGTQLSEKTKENFQKKLREKFEPKKPGFFTRIWQSIFGKPKAEEIGALNPEAAAFDPNRFEAQQAQVEPQQIPPQIIPPGGAPAAVEAIAAAEPMAPPAPPVVKPIQAALNELKQAGIEIPDSNENNDFRDPMSLEIMTDPVIAADGFTYDRVSIEEVLKKEGALSPMDAERKPLENKNLTPNKDMESKIVSYLESLKVNAELKPPHP